MVHINPDQKVVLFAYSQINPEFSEEHITQDEIAAFAAWGCRNKDSSFEVWKKNKLKKPENMPSITERILRKSAAVGHRSVLDQSSYTFSIANVPRATTLQLCSPQFAMHLQQTQRFIKGTDFYFPNLDKHIYNKATKIMQESFDFYKQMVNKKEITLEDSRYILPLGTTTNITTTLNASSLTHLVLMTRNANTPTTTKKTIELLLDEGKKVSPLLFSEWESDKAYNWDIHNFVPSQQLYSPSILLNELICDNKDNKPNFINHLLTDRDLRYIEAQIKNGNESEFATIKHIHNDNSINGFLVPISLAGYHQLIRQRTLDVVTQDIFSAVDQGIIVIPPTIKGTNSENEYIELNKKMIDTYYDLLRFGVDKGDASLVLPHSLTVYNLVHVNGFNMAAGFMKDRLCHRAQWEIRDIAWSIRNIMRENVKTNYDLGRIMQTKAYVFGGCPEPCAGACKPLEGTTSERFYTFPSISNG